MYQAIEIANMLLIYKIRNNLLPTYLADFLVLRSQIHGYTVRNKRQQTIRINFVGNAPLLKQLFNGGLRLFNALLDTIKNSPSVLLLRKD